MFGSNAICKYARLMRRSRRQIRPAARGFGARTGEEDHSLFLSNEMRMERGCNLAKQELRNGTMGQLAINGCQH